MLASRTVPGIDKCSMENEWMQGWHWEDTYMDFHNLNWHFLEAGMTWPSWKQKHIFLKKKKKERKQKHIFIYIQRELHSTRDYQLNVLRENALFRKKKSTEI